MSERILIDEPKCTGCGLCVKVCMVNYVIDGGVALAREKPLLCAECGHCVAVCPTGAIMHPCVGLDECQPLDEADRPGYEQFLGFLKMRRSRREFRDQPVPREVIDKLMAAAVEAPNGLNRKNVCYTVITDRQVMKKMSDRISEQTLKLCNLLRNPIGRAIFKLIQPGSIASSSFSCR